MAADYASGSATSFADLLAALVGFLTGNGWSAGSAADGGHILTKGAAVARLWAVAGDPAGLYLQGGTGSAAGALTGPAPYASAMKSQAPVPVVFPVTYEFYINDTPDEVYVVMSYGGNKYQHLSFGLSDIPGIGGTGMWYTGAMREDCVNNRAYQLLDFQNAGTSLDGFCYGYFSDQQNGRPSSFVHCGLEGAPAWREGARNSYDPNWNAGAILGQNHLAGLLQALPSQFNESEVLLPIYASMLRTDGTQTVVATMRHARFLRIDNVTPGDLITYGSEQWRAYPLYAKNTGERDGVGWNIGADHSGTWGVALRYPGA